MKLLLLHGPAKASSRKKLVEEKGKFDPNDVVVFEEGVDVQDIANNLVSTALFADERLVVLENPDIDSLQSFSPEWAHSFQTSLTLLFWFDHELSDRSLIFKWVKENKGQISFFAESKEFSIFPFLDYLGSRDKRAYLEMDKLKKGGFDSQYFITMIFYLLRNLVVMPENAKDFVKKKNAKMRTNFSEEELVNLYKFILEIDFKLKSGLLEKDQAEFILVNKFIN